MDEFIIQYKYFIVFYLLKFMNIHQSRMLLKRFRLNENVRKYYIIVFESCHIK